MSETWVQATGLTKRFGGFTAVDAIDLSVRRGEVLGFLGPNGAGKTTTMRMLTGFLEPSAGEVRIGGIDLDVDPIAAKEKIGYLPEGAPLYADMTPRQLLTFVARIRRMEAARMQARIAAVCAQLELHEVMDQAIDTLSKGFKRRVGLAQAILHEPDILILDEPTDGLDPIQKQEVRRLIQTMAPEKAIIISTHILEEVEAVCTRAVILARGRIVSDGTPSDLMAQSVHHNRVRLTMLGVDAGEAATALTCLKSIGGAELLEKGKGRLSFALTPKRTSVDLGEVGRLAQEKGWPIEALEVERGSLDEVFIRLAGGERA